MLIFSAVKRSSWLASKHEHVEPCIAATLDRARIKMYEIDLDISMMNIRASVCFRELGCNDYRYCCVVHNSSESLSMPTISFVSFASRETDSQSWILENPNFNFEEASAILMIHV